MDAKFFVCDPWRRGDGLSGNFGLQDRFTSHPVWLSCLAIMITERKNEGTMSGRIPRPNPDRATRPSIPAPADYSDELSNAQLAALRSLVPQDERKMGALVHEFTW